MKLYVDGELVGTNPQTAAQDYTGYWRVGGDNTWGSCSAYFDGTIDEAAVYSYELRADRMPAHFTAGGGVLNQAPTAAFTSNVEQRRATFNASGLHRSRRHDRALRLGLRRRHDRHRRDPGARVRRARHLHRDPDGDRQRGGDRTPSPTR